MNKAFIFPGQGSQAVGMGKDLIENFPIAREVFAIVDDALSQNLSKIILDGPIDALTSTENTQPALMCLSMAFINTIKHETGKEIHQLCDIVAGHSLGEYTALCAAGAFSIADAAKILRIRGKAMQSACPKGEGAMAAILGLDIHLVEDLVFQANKHGICDVANDNNATQVVVSGTTKSIDFIIEESNKLGGRGIKLNVSAPFHSKLILSAGNIMREALEDIKWTTPMVPIIPNITVESTSDIDTIKNALVKQVSGRVRWRETMNYLAELGIQECVEIGCGKVLTGLMKKVEHNFRLTNIGNIQELESYIHQ
jgi:[acyl-carrier-protein] S-malonyltransferase